MIRLTTLAVIAVVMTAVPSIADNPYLKPNNSWISIDGEVKSVSADTFELNYGDGVITVEMDDGDRDADAYKFVEGDKVRVSGMIDDDLFERRTIEAGSVYVENLDTYFYASSIDEEDAVLVTVTTPVIVSESIVQGEVVEIGTQEFWVKAGGQKIEVEVDQMPYNPVDDKGYLKVKVGDRVRVTGKMEDGFFGGREFEALTLVKLGS